MKLKNLNILPVVSSWWRFMDYYNTPTSDPPQVQLRGLVVKNLVYRVSN